MPDQCFQLLLNTRVGKVNHSQGGVLRPHNIESLVASLQTCDRVGVEQSQYVEVRLVLLVVGPVWDLVELEGLLEVLQSWRKEQVATTTEKTWGNQRRYLPFGEVNRWQVVRPNLF